MEASTVSIFIGVALAAGLVGGLSTGAGHRVVQDEVALARACSGSSNDRQMDSTLFIVRADSDGSDPVCDALEMPLDTGFVQLSRPMPPADLALASSLRPARLHAGANAR